MHVWIKYDQNVQLEMDGWHISYNRDTGNTMFGNIFKGDEPAETALCKDGQYWILNGDWRKDYEKLVDKGFWACYQFYLKRKDASGSSWSSPDLDVKMLDPTPNN